MSACCRPRSAASTSARSAPAPPTRSRRCSAGKPPAEVPAAVGAALAVALAAEQADLGDDGLCRPAGALHPLVRAALGREPRQGRQGHDAARGARPGRPAQPAAALHRRPARQAVHDRHRRRRRPRPAHRRPISPSSPASRTSPARPSAIWWRRRAAPPPRRWPRTAARCAPSISNALDERQPRRTADAFHAGDDHRRALLGVDPFDQPAVEEGKVLAKQYLAGSARPLDWRAMIRITDTHQHRRGRARGKLRALLRAGRAERQQALDRGAAALRRAAFAVAAERRGAPADAARRPAPDQGRRAGASSRRTTAPRSATAPRRASG